MLVMRVPRLQTATALNLGTEQFVLSQNASELSSVAVCKFFIWMIRDILGGVATIVGLVTACRSIARPSTGR